MNILRVALVTLWLALALISAQAFMGSGMLAGEVFFRDIQALSWPAQFNFDLLGHLILFSAWVAWRHAFRPIGIILAVFCIIGGGLFTFAYLLVASLLSRGNAKALLLGKVRTQ